MEERAAQRQRAMTFITRCENLCSPRREPFKYGTALFHPALPKVWDLNFLRVEASPGSDVLAGKLVEEAERLQGRAGLGHRKLAVNDEALGERLAPDLKASGWEATRLLLMVKRRQPDRRSQAAVVRPIDLDTMKAARERSLVGDPEISRDDDSLAQLRDQAEVIADALHATFIAAFVDGDIASTCELYSDGRSAQIEAVLTLEEHRGRGLARAVVLDASDRAEASGHDFVFLIAEHDDWPKELYVKLGFDPIGNYYHFTRKPS